jgi:hypothetical protein
VCKHKGSSDESNKWETSPGPTYTVEGLMYVGNRDVQNTITIKGNTVVIENEVKRGYGSYINVYVEVESVWS